MLYGYTRVSTDDQSHALQRDALILAGVSEENIYGDTTTGKRNAGERPEFSRMLERLSQGDIVLVWKLDRLGRSMLDVVQTVTTLADRSIYLRSLQEGVDTATPLGRALVGILASLAQLERENIRERVKAGMDAASRRGVHWTTQAGNKGTWTDCRYVPKPRCIYGEHSTPDEDTPEYSLASASNLSCFLASELKLK